MNNRDDFSIQIKTVLCERVGGICSNPSCRRPTTGPHSNPDKRLSIGVAAHITAAAPGGPRFDPMLSADQRSSAENGIWLCQTCATLIDKDEVNYPVCTLIQWKRKAEIEQQNRLLNGVSNNKSEKIEININTGNAISKAKGNYKADGLWRTLAKNLEEYHAELNNAYQIWENNFGRKCMDKDDLQNSIDTYGDNLYYPLLTSIYEGYSRTKIALMESIEDISIDLSVYLRNILYEYLDLMTFHYMTDRIGFVNNYWSEFFITLANNHDKINQLKAEMDVLIRSEYKVKFSH